MSVTNGPWLSENDLMEIIERVNNDSFEYPSSAKDDIMRLISVVVDLKQTLIMKERIIDRLSQVGTENQHSS